MSNEQLDQRSFDEQSESLQAERSTEQDRHSTSNNDSPLSISELHALLARASALHTKKTRRIEELESELALAQDRVLSLEETITLQRRRIEVLSKENEHIGADREVLRSLERRLEHISPNPHAALAELLAWQQLGSSRLAPTVEVAHKQLDVLWNYVREMGSPGHRIVAVVGRVLAATWLGRNLRKFLHFTYLMLNTK